MGITSTVVGYLLEISAIWGIRWMFKKVKVPILKRVTNRVKVKVPEDGHTLRIGEKNKPISFSIKVQNPTPLNISIQGGSIDISYNSTIICSLPIIKAIEIPSEFDQKIQMITYNPLSYPIGLPHKNGKLWRLDGYLAFRCYYGDWEVPIKTIKPFSIADEGSWNEAREHIAKLISEIRG